MKEEEMKNRISLALKDPILQQGFEIICKENAELKKQIEEMKCCSNCAFEYPKTDGNSEICRRCRRYPKPFTEWKLDNGR